MEMRSNSFHVLEFAGVPKEVSSGGMANIALSLFSSEEEMDVLSLLLSLGGLPSGFFGIMNDDVDFGSLSKSEIEFRAFLCFCSLSFSCSFEANLALGSIRLKYSPLGTFNNAEQDLDSP